MSSSLISSWLSTTAETILTRDWFKLSLFSTSSLLHTLLLVYFLIEVCFAFLFHFYLVPRANQRTAPQPYRDYGKNRDRMLIRVIERMKQTFPDKQDFQKAVVSFLHEWCEPIAKEQPLLTAAAAVKEETDVIRLKTKGSHASSSPPPPYPLQLCRESIATFTTSDVDGDSSLSSSSDDDDVIVEKHKNTNEKETMSRQQSTPSSGNNETFIVPDIKKEEVDEFFAWALFEKEPSQLLDWEHDILAKCYQLAQQEYGIGIAPGNCHRYKPRRLSLEDVNSLWRPLAIYFFFWTLTIVGAVILRWAGFQRIVSQQTGLTGWYRPAATTNGQSLLPLLFFHGIAPAGLFFYIPKILFRLANDDRAVFLFDNTNISCALGFGALREAETVQGVLELVDRYLPDSSTTGLCLCGHSFGSCPLTWLLQAPAMRNRIKQFVLLDPVTILLSEPDVMANFLYSKKCSTIRVMASSELFTEYYLRRHFAWYNSELWLEDIPDSVQVLVALSEKDEIVNVSKVKKHIDLFLSADKDDSKPSQQQSRFRVLFWEEATHAMCVTSPSRWTEIKQAMLEQELAIAKKSS